MSFFDIIDRLRVSSKAPENCLLSLETIRREWYRIGKDPDIAVKLWEHIDHADKELSLEAFTAKFAGWAPNEILARKKPGRPPKAKP